MRARLSQVMGRSGLRSLCARAFRWSGVLVLNYHRVGDGHTSLFDRGLFSADPHAFRDQIRLCKRSCDVIAPADLPDVLARRRGRYVLITFDDGYRDNYELAYPILKSEGATATFFVATGFIDSPRIPWWDEIAWMVRTSRLRAAVLPDWFPARVPFDDSDRENAVRTLLRKYKSIAVETTDAYLNAIADATGTGRYVSRDAERWWMTWDVLREMQAGGMTIGGHTVSHPVLARAPRQRQLAEIEQCGDRLAAELGRPMRYFSYPVGGSTAFDAVTRECLTSVGVQFAFSYYSGYRRFDDWDDYDIRRVPMESASTGDWFRSVLALPQLFS